MSVYVESISKSFDSTKVFENVSFEVNSGEIVCIKGKSGEGKTTLLRCLNNLEQIDGGKIIIDGVDISKEKDYRIIGQMIGMVFQSFNLFPHLSVMENLLIAPMYLKKDNEDKIRLKAMELIKTLEIEGKENMYPYQLSGGQKQRVAIARACMLNPTVLCFDEPTSALDNETTKQIGKVIRRLANEGMAIIIVTHDEAFVDEIGERVLTMKNGNLKEEILKF